MGGTKPHVSRPLQDTGSCSDCPVQFAGLKRRKEVSSNTLKLTNAIQNPINPSLICLHSLAEVAKKVLFEFRITFRAFHTVQMPHPLSGKISIMVDWYATAFTPQIPLDHQLGPASLLEILKRDLGMVHGIYVHQVGGIRVIHCDVSLMLTFCPKVTWTASQKTIFCDHLA